MRALLPQTVLGCTFPASKITYIESRKERQENAFLEPHSPLNSPSVLKSQIPHLASHITRPIRDRMVVPPVEDFPQMWQRPCAADLVEILHSLEVKPPTWSHKRRPSHILEAQAALGAQKKGEVTRYLSSVTKSPLAWIEDDTQREDIWELASKRMSERCGRSAMGEIVRAWPFGSDSEEGTPLAQQDQQFELIIREPALTGDSLGFKTWGSSYVLAQQLPRLATTSLSRLFDESLGQPGPNVLELGSGTGLLGLAAAALWRVPVALSDLPNIVPNLQANADNNADLIKARGGSLQIGPLTWGGSGDDEVDPELFGRPFQFKVCTHPFLRELPLLLTG